ncbi:MAG: hypothetical protein CBC49_009605 [Alphaproteobacteria bacterium TMED89]|nr:MAG: hypothetical protein CBC49_009605 [Alphaproteobacteria bacterium TMED89]
MTTDPDRRRLLSLLAGSALSLGLNGRAAGQIGAGLGGTGIDGGLGGTGIDGGIGGTGIDGGLGGTGIFGLIEGFSSIWVNDVQIEIPADAEITLNGRPAREGDLTLGQTVAVEAQEDGQGRLLARRIDATYALVGPISSAAPFEDRLRLIVLGQAVEVSPLNVTDNLRPGDWVVVTGLRDHRGAIQAANVALTSSREAVVTGPVSRDGRVAGMQVVYAAGTQSAPSLRLMAGTRATVTGPLTNEAEPRLVALTVSSRPLEMFDQRRFRVLVLGGLPGGEDGTLIVDGVRFSLPGARGRAEPWRRGLRDRIHGRFGVSTTGLRAIGTAGAPMQPLAPFAGPGRRGPGEDRPHFGKIRRTGAGIGNGSGVGNEQNQRRGAKGANSSGIGRDGTAVRPSRRP